VTGNGSSPAALRPKAHGIGTPLHVGEMVLLVGALGCLTATGYLRIVVRKPPYRTSEDTVSLKL